MLDRHKERSRLDDLIERLREGGSSTLLLNGGAGVGKTTVLTHLTSRSAGMQVLTVTGVQSEMRLPYSALHQLCRPLMPALPSLPAPQRAALEIMFGMREGAFPDRFLLGLATLSLLGEASRTQPVLCVIDDAQWLDEGSAHVLGFVARRLRVESVGMVFAVRTPGDTSAFDGLPRLAVAGLGRADAEALLTSLVPGPIDPRALNRILDEADGNPLSLVEAARVLARAEISTGLILRHGSVKPHQLEERFRARVAVLPAETRRLLLVAAADPTADPQLIGEASDRLAIDPDAILPAAEAGLCAPGLPVRFRHPLIRSAVYRAADPDAVRSTHAALAEVSAGRGDPDLLSWHRAQSAAGIDEAAAIGLAEAGERARARGGGIAAAAFLREALTLTADSRRRARWQLRLAQTELASGRYRLAADEVENALHGDLDEALAAEATLTRARVEFARERGGLAVPLLLDAARRLRPRAPDAAREAYFEALSAAMFGSSLSETDVRLVSREWLASGLVGDPRVPYALLDAMASVLRDETPGALHTLQRAVGAFGVPVPGEREHLPWLWHATIAALAVWDMETWDAVSARHLELARAAGDYAELPIALTTRTYLHLFAGNMPAALAAVREMEVITAATRGGMNPSGAVGAAALQGEDARLRKLVESTIADAHGRADGSGVAVAHWAAALLHNSRGRYRDAREWASRASELHNPLHSATNWALVESVEAASRLPDVDPGEDLERLRAATVASGSDWGTGVYERSLALTSADDSAEDHYVAALESLERSGSRLDGARASLVYGEWLRRRRRQSQAREHLQRAYRAFTDMGMSGFGARARAELEASGERARKEWAGDRALLTGQETQIAQLAVEGLTNGEIATRLFLSSRTVEHHLAKVFGKLHITSRQQLAVTPTGEIVAIHGEDP
ncbi:ATP-binding protein [Microbacterium timonense]|uniref:ATP-binding protein n=1 Tax=Microbacterium timonense TaxID=2086576 RepID=UPI0013592C58|nr:helix-turn-helix transcriptional regulator [Microbacterium timonense]